MQKHKDEEIIGARKKAIALAYDNEVNSAPLVVAAGTGFMAEKILKLADETGIPVFQDDTATTLLYQLDIGQEIPEKLYEVVAQIFAYIMKTAKEVK